jgi:DNA-binding response OmpR family regulator
MHGDTATPPERAEPPPVFVVEDDPLMRSLLSEVAASVGLQPLTFTRLSSARAALRERIPAVLVVDDDLPDGRGGDFVHELKADPRTRHVRVVMCTSAGSHRRRHLGRLVPVVHKPFAIHELEDVLRRLAARQVA